MRPKDEIMLINKICAADSVLQTPMTRKNMQDAIYLNSMSISDYLTNKLNAKVTNWVAYTDMVTTEVLNGKDTLAVIFGFNVTKNWQRDTSASAKQPEIRLTGMIRYVDKSPFFKELQTLKKGDRVLLSGELEKYQNKVIMDTLFSKADPLYGFMFPAYKIQLSSIKKL